MVRRKEDSKPQSKPVVERKIRPVKPVAHEPELVASAKVRPARIRREGGAGRLVVAVVFVLVLLGIGWFATQWVLGSKDGGVLSGLIGGGNKLQGEDEGRVNFLLMGIPGDPTHDGPDLTDTLILASYDTENKYLSMFSIPRDLYVQVDGYNPSRINTVYAEAKSAGESGEKLLVETVEKLVDMEIPYYMRIDFAGFEKVVDELGGVTVEVKKDLSDPFYPGPNNGYETVEFKAGTHTFDGENALKYVRSRKTTSDFDRALRQQDVMVSLRDKAMDLELLTAPTKAMEILEVLSSHFVSNLKKQEFERFLAIMTELDTTKVSSFVLDDSASSVLYGTRVDGAYVLKPINDDYSKIAEFVASKLGSGGSEPTQAEEVKTEPLKLEVMNGTNVTGLAGKIADKLSTLGFSIVRAGNNPTKGIKDAVIYDGTAGKKFSEIKKLAEILNATVSTETITLPAGVEARLVVGESSQAFIQ